MEKIALLLSGGVDSSVALYRLKQQGYTPDCFYIKIGPEEDTEWNCTSEEDLEMATALCRKFGCKLQVVDLHHEYWDKVVAYTMEKVKAGLTPNPDVMCNKLIKFGCFEEKAGHEYDLIATGHYATTAVVDGKKWLATSPDPVKDQTDFLAQLDTFQLKKAIFPIGDLYKHEVREIAEREHLVTAKRKDSQGICFLGKINYNDYIKRFLGEKEGYVINADTNKKMGMHKGYWFYTIGQRHGLGFGGGPWYVVKKDIEYNIVYISNKIDLMNYESKELNLRNVHFITEDPWGELPAEGKRICFKIRHSPEYLSGTITKNGDIYHIEADESIQGIAPGQFGVLYDADHKLCYGSGEITL
ncbi:MAG: tRNA 2-thiouridine(34) synthase MnmA [Paludibacteraceae bacterium]|nr:tRNA 2-thiouridine(34) synthase MnmA [Paludibacteraceae bacterium]